MKVSIELRDGPDGRLLDDWSADAIDPVIRTDKRGLWSFTLSVPVGAREAFEFYADSARLWLIVSHGGKTIWRGRVEDVRISGGLADITAYGPWNYLADTLYTALWIDGGYGRWRLLDSGDNAARSNNRWQADNNNRLYAAPVKDEQFSNAAQICSYGYVVPSGSERQITGISFSYAMEAPSGDWRVRVCRADSAWSSNLTTIWQLESNGSAQTGTGSVDWTGTPTDRVVVEFFYDAAGPTTYSGETGEGAWFKLTAVEVTTTDSAALYAGEVAAALTAYAIARGAPLLPDDALIHSPGVAIDELVIEDTRPSELLQDMAGWGDDSEPPRSYEVGVWEDLRLFFRPRIAAGDIDGDGDHAVWHLLVDDVELERSLAGVSNSVYARYNSDERTARLKDADSIAMIGVERDDYVDVSTSSSSRAETVRAAKLADTANLASRASILITAVMDHLGTDVPYWEVRSGDVAYLANLPAGNRFLDGVRWFEIETTELNLETGELVLTPAELPTLDVLVAKG